MGNLKRNDTNELIYKTRKRLTDLKHKLTVARGKGGGERTVREFGMDMCTLLYFKWITNKDLLYSTGNSAQCYVVTWMGGEFGGEWIHVYVWLSPFAVYLKLSNIVNCLYPVNICSCLVTQSCLTLYDPMDCCPPGSSEVHGIKKSQKWVEFKLVRCEFVLDENLMSINGTCSVLGHCLGNPIVLGFSRLEYWSGWPFPSPGQDLPDPGI